MKFNFYQSCFIAFRETDEEKIPLQKFKQIADNYDGEDCLSLFDFFKRFKQNNPDVMFFSGCCFYPEGEWLMFWSPSGENKVYTDIIANFTGDIDPMQLFDSEEAFMRAFLFYPDATDWEEYAETLFKNEKPIATNKKSEIGTLAYLSGISESIYKQLDAFDWEQPHRFVELNGKDIKFDFSSIHPHVSSVTRFEIPNRVTEVEMAYCALKEILLPQSVKNITTSATTKYLQKAETTIFGVKGSTSEKFASENGLVFRETAPVKEKKKVVKKKKSRSFFFAKKDEVEADGYVMGAYYDYDFTHVQVETGATRIGRFAFNLCHKLKTVFLPPTVTEIGRDTFDSCPSLVHIYLPKSLKKISSTAFCGTPSKQMIFHVEPKSFAYRYATKNGIAVETDYADMAKQFGIELE